MSLTSCRSSSAVQSENGLPFRFSRTANDDGLSTSSRIEVAESHAPPADAEAPEEVWEGQDRAVSTERPQQGRLSRRTRPTRHSLSSDRQFRVRQQWEGVITRLTADGFEAELRDLTAPSNSTEFAEFPLDEVTEADRPLIAIGSVFYWVIGYETIRRGQISNVSELRFRRLPQWTQREIEAVREKGQKLFERYAQNGKR